ncbi:Interleukin-12 subunit beta [Dissostichus eleginoides]|uniref:Interleukin-12 subunit beta n=1 Tax=Dissostichus eleginoides TaxID=100907 RepID=A0AAD9EZG5_DISEL|nr:Interleukin-12 subunit beta [Dissostichus eleginoides]
MRALFLVVLYAGLCYASSDSDQDEVETLMSNVLVLKRSKGVSREVNVAVSCGGAYENQAVVWKKDGEIVPGLLGNEIKVLVKELAGGNYSCHLGQNGEYLNHTVILVQLDPENKTVILEEKSPGKGEIHLQNQRRRARVKVERNSSSISCELDADGSGIHCQEKRCPFDEEQNSISLTIYIHNFSLLEAYSKSFYLRDIVRPETLPNLQLGMGRCSAGATPSPGSEEIIMRNTTQDTNYQVKVKNSRFVFCVRAQDKYTNGLFSRWSQCKVDKGNNDCSLTSPKP